MNNVGNAMHGDYLRSKECYSFQWYGAWVTAVVKSIGHISNLLHR